jgi:hypothetical protein
MSLSPKPTPAAVPGKRHRDFRHHIGAGGLKVAVERDGAVPGRQGRGVVELGWADLHDDSAISRTRLAIIRASTTNAIRSESATI